MHNLIYSDKIIFSDENNTNTFLKGHSSSGKQLQETIIIILHLQVLTDWNLILL